MKTRILLAAAAALALGACVTVNVYFPAAEVKDLSRKIEDEVQKEAAKAQDQAAEPPQAPEKAPEDPSSPGDSKAPRGTNTPGAQDAPADGTKMPAGEARPGTTTTSAARPASLFDTLLGVTPAYAQGVADPEVTSPAIRKIIESRAARVAAIDKHKATGVIGENNKALLEIRSLDAITDLKSRAEAQRLVKEENADRTELFKEIAVAKKVDSAQTPKIQETYAQTIRERARAGDWIQMPDGAWKQK